MKNRTFFFVSLALLFCLAATIAGAAATSAQKQSVEERVALLEKHVADLQERVSKLEKQLTWRVTPVNAGREAKPGIAPWRALHKGMTKDEVKKLLGEPKDMMKLNEYDIWDYAGGGSVRFDVSGRVEGWYEP